MSDPPRYTGANDATVPVSNAGWPTWAKVLAWVVPIVLVAIVVGLHLTGVVGPGR
jgi:hypothetical protein